MSNSPLKLCSESKKYKLKKKKILNNHKNCNKEVEEHNYLGKNWYYIKSNNIEEDVSEHILERQIS